MKKKLLFDYYERKLTIDFYKKYPNWKYDKPLCVSMYEITKAKKEFQRVLEYEFNKMVIFTARIVTFLKGKTFTLLS